MDVARPGRRQAGQGIPHFPVLSQPMPRQNSNSSARRPSSPGRTLPSRWRCSPGPRRGRGRCSSGRAGPRRGLGLGSGGVRSTEATVTQRSVALVQIQRLNGTSVSLGFAPDSTQFTICFWPMTVLVPQSPLPLRLGNPHTTPGHRAVFSRPSRKPQIECVVVHCTSDTRGFHQARVPLGSCL